MADWSTIEAVRYCNCVVYVVPQLFGLSIKSHFNAPPENTTSFAVSSPDTESVSSCASLRKFSAS